MSEQKVLQSVTRVSVPEALSILLFFVQSVDMTICSETDKSKIVDTHCVGCLKSRRFCNLNLFILGDMVKKKFKKKVT